MTVKSCGHSLSYLRIDQVTCVVSQWTKQIVVIKPDPQKENVPWLGAI